MTIAFFLNGAELSLKVAEVAGSSFNDNFNDNELSEKYLGKTTMYFGFVFLIQHKLNSPQLAWRAKPNYCGSEQLHFTATNQSKCLFYTVNNT